MGCCGNAGFRRGRRLLCSFAWMQAFQMLIQKFFTDEAEPVVEAGLVDVVTAHVFRVGQPARPAVDDDLFPCSELLLVHGVGESAQNENLPASVSSGSCRSSTSFKTLRTMNALSDYLTYSGREESGGLLGAYCC